MRVVERPRSRLAISFIAVLFLSTAAVAETETETIQTRTTGSFSQYTTVKLVPSPVAGASNYTEGNGTALFAAGPGFLSVHVHASEMARQARFSLVLVVNGVSRQLANMTTDDDGGVEAEAGVPLAPANYSLGVKVLDTSTFGTPTVVLVSSPSSVQVSILQRTTTTQVSETQSVSTYSGGQSEDDEINTALQTSFIPAVVDLGESGSGASVHVNDNRFAVSIGTFNQDGYVITVSGNNVTGPRVIMVNLTRSAAKTLFSDQVLVTLDGANVQQASNFTQVISAKAGDPSRFIVISSGSAFRFLISIPHFSSHSIDIVPFVSRLAAALMVDIPAVLLSLAALTIVVTVIYDRRTRLVV